MLKLSCKVITGEPIRAAVLYEILANSIRGSLGKPHLNIVSWQSRKLTPLDDVVTGPALMVIDTWTDSDVGAFWMGDAMQRFVVLNGWHVQQRNMPPLGMMSLKVSDEGRPFRGLSGMTNTKGSFRIPFALTFEDPKQKLPGVMDTHVIDGKVPLLSSQHAQAALNLVKQMGSSIITVEVNGPKLELCRVEDSGLLCINLSSALMGLKEKKLPRTCRNSGCQVWEILQPTLPWLQMLRQARPSSRVARNSVSPLTSSTEAPVSGWQDECSKRGCE